MKHRARVRLEEARAASHAPPYDEVITAHPGGSVYSVNRLLQQSQKGTLIDTVWPSREDRPSGVIVEGMNPHGLVLVGGCGTQGCEDCEREMDEIEDALEREERDGTDELC